jgi:hyaluronate lyase
MFIDHGVRPDIADSAYEYIILPQLSGGKNEIKAYANAPEVQILSNTGKVQAVYKNGLDIFAANFFADQETVVDGYVICNKKASVITKTTGNTFDIGISDPTHKNTGKTTVTFIGKNASLVSKDERVTVINSYPLTIEVDMNKSRGKTISAQFTLQ